MGNQTSGNGPADPEDDVVIGWPLGHFHSPIPSLSDLRRDRDRIWRPSPAALPGIDLCVDEQLSLLERFEVYYREQPFGPEPRPGLRYYFENDYFSYADALVLYCMLRHGEPSRFVEVGSGFSSAVVLDTNARYLDNRVSCTFIEPYPEDRLSWLAADPECPVEFILSPVQDVPLATFDTLTAGDILFIDSSHVSKTGSDVNVLIHEVLPRIAPGVLVHFHDVFYPFEYPERWVFDGWAWNEAYLLRAFLAYNEAFTIRFFNNYLWTHHRSVVKEAMPLFANNPGGSLWLQRR